MDSLAHPSISPQEYADATTSRATGRRPSPQPSWPLDSSQAPCLSFPESLSPLLGDQEGSPALPGQAEPRALHVAGQAPRPASEDADLHGRPGPGVKEAHAFHVQEAARMGSPGCPGRWALGSPLVAPCPCPSSPLLLNKQGALNPSCWTDLCQGPSRR